MLPVFFVVTYLCTLTYSKEERKYCKEWKCNKHFLSENKDEWLTCAEESGNYIIKSTNNTMRIECSYCKLTTRPTTKSYIFINPFLLIFY